MRTSISSQTLNGIYKQSNKRGSKSFTIKEPLPQQKMDCLPLMTRGVLSHMQRTQKAQSGNTVAHSKEKKSVMWESVSPSFQRQNIFPLISYRIFPLMNFPVVKTILTLKTNSTLLKNSLINPWKPSNSLPLPLIHGMLQLTFLSISTPEKKSSSLK